MLVIADGTVQHATVGSPGVDRLPLSRSS